MHIITFLLILIASSLLAQPMKVMTYNIRYDNPGDGPNQWDKRKDKVFRLLKKYDPDIIGVQEALHHQLEDIEKNLKVYEYFGAGRDDGKQKGEYSAVFIRKDRFKILDENTFWLSKTPEVPGSKDWDAAITRVVTWARLQDKKTGEVFVMINTHFDHIGKESRKNSAVLLKEKAATLGKDLPVIITGDFNFTRDKPPYEVMMDPSSLRLVDAAGNESPGTACGFEVGARPCSAIDYIFHTPQWRSDNYQVVQDHDGKYYPSDHLPVIATISLKK
jgi:endonuclease/exonuclease/phosphatase family metal-dependent hydrolase